VLITGDTTGTRAESMESAGWKVLYKPIDAARLLATIVALLADTGRERELPAKSVD
jgi:DNA-binding response OmpR family regulator